MTIKKIIVHVFFAIAFCSCASSYKEVMPNKTLYKDCFETGGLGYCYKHNVLGSVGNKKLFKKEVKSGVKLLAVKIENNTGRDILFKRDVKIYMGDELVIPVEAKQMYNHLKQRPASHLLWSFFWVFIAKGNGPYEAPTVYPIPIGAVIGITNMAIAIQGNQGLMYELTKYNILSKEIKNGETVYGLIGISSDKALPITLKLDQ